MKKLKLEDFELKQEYLWNFSAVLFGIIINHLWNKFCNEKNINLVEKIEDLIKNIKKLEEKYNSKNGLNMINFKSLDNNMDSISKSTEYHNDYKTEFLNLYQAEALVLAHALVEKGYLTKDRINDFENIANQYSISKIINLLSEGLSKLKYK
jgi:hypothetical protein